MNVARRLRAIEKILDESPYNGPALTKFAKFSCDCELEGIDLSPWDKRIDAIRQKMYNRILENRQTQK